MERAGRNSDVQRRCLQPLGANVVLGTYNATTGDRFLSGSTVTALRAGGQRRVAIRLRDDQRRTECAEAARPADGIDDRQRGDRRLQQLYGRVVSLNGRRSGGLPATRPVRCALRRSETGAGITNAEDSAPRLDSTSTCSRAARQPTIGSLEDAGSILEHGQCASGRRS